MWNEISCHWGKAVHLNPGPNECVCLFFLEGEICMRSTLKSIPSHNNYESLNSRSLNLDHVWRLGAKCLLISSAASSFKLKGKRRQKTCQWCWPAARTQPKSEQLGTQVSLSERSESQRLLHCNATGWDFCSHGSGVTTDGEVRT